MKLSVIVPVYNAEKFLDRSITSLEKQNHEDYEIILVDDGSKDKSLEICQHYAEKYSNVFVFHKENGGCVSARRLGLSKASGEFFCFVDADDYVDETYINNIYEAIKVPADLYLFNNYINKKGTNDFYIEKDFIETKLIKDKKTIYDWILIGGAVSVWDKVYKKDIVEKYNIEFLEDISFGEDVFINSQYLKGVDTMYVYNNAAYYHFRDAVGSVSVNVITTKRFHELDVVYRYGKQLLLNSDMQEIISNFNARCVGNYLRTVSMVKRGKIKRSELTNEITKYSIYSELKSMNLPNMKSKIQSFLLYHKMYNLIALLTKQV